MFHPRFTLTPAIAKNLMEIEACRQAVQGMPLSVRMLDALRHTAKLLSTHFSTQIEGNRLSPMQVEEVLEGGGRFPGRERDEAEVRNYYKALEFATEEGGGRRPLGEKALRTIHGLVLNGRKAATAYRDGQNVIRDARTGAMVYLPPEANDVPLLMKDLVAWINAETERGDLPAPVIAGLAHYQFATIHPYYDGNGRTARLLTNLILHRGGYGLHGIYSLEEYYAEHLQDYYDALAVTPGHNYYEGRAEADVTPFLVYFIRGMAGSFAKIRNQAGEAQGQGVPGQTALLRELSARQRKALSLFARMKRVASADVARFFRIGTRSASALCLQWVEEKFLMIADPSKKARRYQLTETYEALMAVKLPDLTRLRKATPGIRSGPPGAWVKP
ncbi:MAG: Fic family protein [Patescibacteria group bacterium]